VVILRGGLLAMTAGHRLRAEKGEMVMSDGVPRGGYSCQVLAEEGKKEGDGRPES
jgi:hypothetical protein